MRNCVIGQDCNIGQNVVISPDVVLGRNVKIQNNVSVYTGVRCEDDVFLGPSMVFTNVINPRSAVSRKDEYRETIIRKGASIGANATIVCGHTLGEYCLIGAGTVVTKDVPAYALMVGNPARQIGWVSRNGEKLHFDAEGNATCLATGEQYVLQNNKVTLVTLQQNINNLKYIVYMKNNFLLYVMTFLFCTVNVMAENFTIGSSTYDVTRTTTQLASGVKYIKLKVNTSRSSSYSSGGMIHVIEADLTDPTVSVKHGDHGRDSRRSLATQAANLSTSTSTVVAGANANFWCTTEAPYATKLKYEPFGASIKDGHMYTDPNCGTMAHVGGPVTTTGMLAINEAGKCFIDYFKPQQAAQGTGSGWNFTLTNHTHPHTFGIDQVNRVVVPGTAAMYSSIYGSSKAFRPVVSAGDYTTQTGSCTEVLMDFASGTSEWNIGGETKLVIKEIRKNAGSGTLGNHDCAIVCRDSYASVANGWAVGDQMTITAIVNFKTKGNPGRIMQATSGNCIILENGVVGFNETQNSYNNKSYARTVYATNDAGTKLWIAVCEHYPNKQYTHLGFTTTQMAYILKNFGATWATQVDCGGSSQMYAGGKQVSTSTDSGGLRNVQSGVFILSTKSAAVTDTEVPKVVRTTTVANTASSFYVYAYATDDVGVTSVKFPTWTNNNDQDDLKWHEGVQGSWTVGGQTYNWRSLVNIADHNNEKGTYTVHVYAYDAAGKNSAVATSYTFATASITSNPTSVTLEGVYGSATQPYADVTITGVGLESDIIINPNSSALTATTLTGWDSRTGGKLRITLHTNFTSGPGTYTDKFVAVQSTSAVRITIPVIFTLKDASTPENPDTPETPSTPDATYGNVKFYYQGGSIEIPADNEALWALFMPDYKTYYNENRFEQPIDKVATFMTQGQAMMTEANSGWKWLGDYIAPISSAKGIVITSEAQWRYAVSQFFNCAAARTDYPAAVSFETEGKPSAWQPVYTLNHEPTKADATFLGWFDNAQGTGTALTTLPASGNVYACWSGGATANPTISVNPSSLSFSGEEGAAIAGQTITVTGADLSAAPTVSAVTCFDVVSSLTQTGGTITVTPKASLLPGTHTETLTISADGISKEVALSVVISEALGGVEPDATYGSVQFYYQDGSLDVPANNAALWELFKPAYNTYYASIIDGWSDRGDQPIEKVSTFAAAKMVNFMTDAASPWKWLGDYVMPISVSQSYALDANSGESAWRWTIHSFFNCSEAGTLAVKVAGFTSAGLPSAWQPYYTFGNKPTKSGYTFRGWFDNADGTGSALTALPSSGDVYACWQTGVATDVESLVSTSTYLVPTLTGVEIFFAGTEQVAIYNVNGMMVAGGVATGAFSCDLQAGVYIVRVGNEMIKFIR